MLIISHRGNLAGPGSLCEKAAVDHAMLCGFDVEVDVRMVGWKIYVGHDEPLYELPRDWTNPDASSRLWFHAKDVGSMQALSSVNHRVFMHEDEPYATVSPCNSLWIHPVAYVAFKDVDWSNKVLLDVDGHPRVDRSALGSMPMAVCTDWSFEWREWLRER